MLLNRGQTLQYCGGKGNIGQFIDRQPKICAAGVPTGQPEEAVGKLVQQYSLQDEVNALVGDAIIPLKTQTADKPRKDFRNAGFFTEVCQIVNPPMKTKVQQLVEDIKSTQYTSFWKQEVGQTPDPRPMFPIGYDIEGTTYGKKCDRSASLYEVIMPIKPLPDMTPKWRAGLQENRKYCPQNFDPNRTYGHKTNQDPRGRLVKCALSVDRVIMGNGSVSVKSSRQTDFEESHIPSLGRTLAPNNISKVVPKGHVFGSKHTIKEDIQDCFTSCKINPEKTFLFECLGHLNSIRRRLFKLFDKIFFKKMYMTLKYRDECKSGWLPKEVVYDYCLTEGVRFDSYYIEPLLSMWKAFDGRNVEYKTFIRVFNFTEPSPELQKIQAISEECLDFRTTYSEMVKTGQCVDMGLRAGLPSGRYFDRDYPVVPEGYCRAMVTQLPQESDAEAVMCPSIFSQFGLTHRDMFSPRQKEIIRKVFEAAGGKFTDDQFEVFWNEAKKYHSAGLVCFETFRRAMNKTLADKESKPNKS